MARHWIVKSPRGAWRYGAALGLVALSTAAAEIIYRVFDTDRLSMVFLAAVLVSAVALGQGPAYFAAAVAFVVYDIYLVEPRFEFTMNSAEDVLVLIVFLGVAVLTGGLAGRLREAQADAEARARASSALFRASEEFSALEEEQAIRQALVQRIGDAGHEALVIDDEDPAPAGAPPPEALQQAMNGHATHAAPGWRLRSLRTDSRLLGVVAWKRGAVPLNDDDRIIAVLVDMAAAAIMRSRLAAERAEMETRAQTEALRNALLSSISHDLRTPLAAILASATSLREFGERFDPAVRDDLILTIQEEAERLNAFVGNLLNMTRLESGALTIETVSFGLAEVVGRVAQRLGRAGGEFVVHASREDLFALGDPILLEQALANVVENAARFAHGKAEITLRHAGSQVIIEVADHGPGVPEADLPMIFEKFYRAASTSSQQGAGLGLSIARGFVEAMGGQVAARAQSEGSGLVVTLALKQGAPA